MTADRDDEHFLMGQIIGAANRIDPEGVVIWFSFRTVGGDAMNERTTADVDGRFSFLLPTVPLDTAMVGAELVGIEPVDLEPQGTVLEPGDLVLVADDIVPSHLRYGS
ncbi:MAG: hypothetical protein ACI8TP_000675 [Acidimicrobiales bacterium]|jgi:hypothetical protein